MTKVERQALAAVEASLAHALENPQAGNGEPVRELISLLTQARIAAALETIAARLDKGCDAA